MTANWQLQPGRPRHGGVMIEVGPGDWVRASAVLRVVAKGEPLGPLNGDPRTEGLTVVSDLWVNAMEQPYGEPASTLVIESPYPTDVLVALTAVLDGSDKPPTAGMGGTE
jgi:hypothetical protein